MRIVVRRAGAGTRCAPLEVMSPPSTRTLVLVVLAIIAAILLGHVRDAFGA